LNLALAGDSGASVPETLLGLVNAYSPSGSEQAAVSALLNRMQALQFTRIFSDKAGNAVGVMGGGPRQIVLLGHIDTVPGEIPVRVAPFIAGESVGSPVLYGRGSVDAKGPLASFVDAVAACGVVPGWQFVVIGAVGEETDSSGARHLVRLYHPQFAIIGEPSRWDRVTLGYKGSAWTSVSLRRPLAHTAGQAENASEAAVRAWLAIRAQADAFNAGRLRSFDQILLTLRAMQSGSDGFMEWASLQVGARLPLDLPPATWYERLRHFPGLSDLPGISIQPSGFPIPAYQAEKNTPLVRAFLAGIRGVGGQPGFVLKSGTADLNIVAPAWECPALAYGPGDSSLDHTPDEHISIAEYARSVEVIKAVLNHLVEGNGNGNGS
jgi:[amino group carrier protein]-lysine/ornithine hydrolase